MNYKTYVQWKSHIPHQSSILRYFLNAMTLFRLQFIFRIDCQFFKLSKIMPFYYDKIHFLQKFRNVVTFNECDHEKYL